MRTTVDLPADLLRQAKARAALDGTTLKELFTQWVEQGLRRSGSLPGAASRRQRSALPVARPATGRKLPALTHAELFELLDGEEVGVGRVGNGRSD